jgi:hypothetical protein
MARLFGSQTAPADIAVDPPQVSPFSTIRTSSPRSQARSAAVWPAPPDPITSTSTEWSQSMVRFLCQGRPGAAHTAARGRS